MNGRRGKARRGTLYLLARRARSRRAKGIDPRVSACPLQTLIHVSPNVPRGTISTAPRVLKSVALRAVHQRAGHRKCSTRWRTKFALTRECLPQLACPGPSRPSCSVLPARQSRRRRTYRERLVLDREGTEEVRQGSTWNTSVAGSLGQVTRGKGGRSRRPRLPLQTVIHFSPNVPRGTISTAAGVLKSVALGTVHQGASTGSVPHGGGPSSP